MKQLKLAKDLTLPLDAVTQTFLIVGKRGSGKSNTAARFVEQLHHAKLPFVVLDPVDTWWGLKASTEGGRGLDVYVFGGSHADVPLEAGGGALIAEVLCEHRMPMVLSVKHLSGRERSTFMVAFAQTLFQKWGGGPLHLVLEEAHELAPQNTQNAKEGEQQMLGAFKRLWKLGRSSGIGGTAVTQRPASLSKDITTQSEILIAHRTIGPQDVKAVGEWVKYHGEHLDLLADLPTLPTGEAFVWAPEFPEGQPIGLQRTAILRRETFDSASTPKVGERRIEPKELAPVDLARLQQRMAATIEKAKADDPRELRKQIVELKRQVEQAGKQSAQNDTNRQVKTVEKPVLTDADRALLEKLRAWLEDAGLALSIARDRFVHDTAQRISEVLTAFTTAADAESAKAQRALLEKLDSKGFQKILEKLASVSVSPQTPPVRPSTTAVPRSSRDGRVAPAPATRRPAVPVPSEGLTSAEQRVLDAVSWWRGAALGNPSRHQVAFVAGYTVNGHFNNLVGGLRSKGLIDYPPQGGVMLTDAGLKVAAVSDEEVTRDALVTKVLGVLEPSPGKIFGAVVDAGRGLTREELAAATGYTVNGHFNNMVGSLRSLGVIDYPSRGGVTLGAMFEALP